MSFRVQSPSTFLSSLLHLSFAFAAGRGESLAWGLGTRLLASAPRRPLGVQLRNSRRIFGVGRTRNAPWAPCRRFLMLRVTF